MSSGNPEDYRRTKERLSQILQPDERVLWEGKPDRIADILSYTPTMAFGAAWLFIIGIIIYMFMIQAGRHEVEIGPVFWLLAAPFVIIGLYLTFGTLTQAVLGWRDTAYVLTTKRLLLLYGALGRTFHSDAYLDSVTVVDIKVGLLDRWRGTGTIVVYTPERDAASTWRLQGLTGPGIQFSAISKPDDVYRIIDQAREQAREPRE